MRHVRRHVVSCPECRELVSEMEAASLLLRRSPLARFRCELGRARLTRTGHGRQWAGAAVAVLALVLATGSLPEPHRSPAPRRPAAVAPLALPIGQRSALDDFVAHPTPATQTS